MIDWRNYKRFLTSVAGERLAASVHRFAGAWLGGRSSERDEEPDDPLDAVRIWLKQMPVPAMPGDLPARIDGRIRQERTKAARVAWTWRLKTCLEPLAIPTAVGLLSALFIFGVFVRIFEVPVHAGSDDVPLTLRTPPRLRTPSLIEADTGIKSMQVALVIDQDGRVADYQIIQGKPTPEQLRLLEYLLVFTVFEPATVFGRPTTETVKFALQDGYLRSMSL